MPRRAARPLTDLRALHPQLYAAKRSEINVVDVPPLLYLAVEGTGRQGDPEFLDAAEALVGAAYSLKSMLRRRFPGSDFAISPMECLWTPGDGSAVRAGDAAPKWTLLLSVPSAVKEGDLAAAASHLRRHHDARRTRDVRLLPLWEGQCAQMLHVGRPNEAILADLARLAQERGLAPSGRAHVVYLDDPRRTQPSRLRAILRVPVRAR